MSNSTRLSFKYFFPDMNFQNLNSSLAIIRFNLLSLKILLPMKDIFLIFAFSPKLISIVKFTKLSFSSSTKI